MAANQPAIPPTYTRGRSKYLRPRRAVVALGAVPLDCGKACLGAVGSRGAGCALALKPEPYLRAVRTCHTFKSVKSVATSCHRYECTARPHEPMCVPELKLWMKLKHE